MKKAITFLIIFVGSAAFAQTTTSSASTPVNQGIAANNEWDFGKKDTWNVVATIVSAAGTISVSVIALFGGHIKNFWNRPKIKLEINDSDICVEETKDESDSSSGKTPGPTHISLRIKNTGRGQLKSAVIVYQGFYKFRTAGILEASNPLKPHFLVWHDGAHSSTVIPNIDAYVQISSIKISEQNSQSGSNNQLASTSYAFISVLKPDGKNAFKLESIKAGKGRFLIPLTFSAENHKQKTIYVDLTWDGDNHIQDKAKISASLMDNKIAQSHINKLKKEGA